MTDLAQGLVAAPRTIFLVNIANNSDPFLLKNLQQEGYLVKPLTKDQLNIDLFSSCLPDLVLIDLIAPSMESVGVCRHIRQSYSGPVLVFAEETGEMLQVLGLEMGADDFLVKPLSPPLLLAKIRALLRRNRANPTDEKTIQLGELKIDATRREVHCCGKDVLLTAREFDLLWCLAEKARTIISRDEIHKALYRSEYNGFDRSIDMYISRIRQKIGDDPQNPRYLKTVRGSGYLLVENIVN